MNFFYNLPKTENGEEVFEIFADTSSFLIERIVSNNAVSPAEGWYEQDHDEWVLVMQGVAIIETETGKTELHTGNSILIPANIRHKVVYTSSNPVCVWLAVHQKK